MHPTEKSPVGAVAVREPRPFLYLTPMATAAEPVAVDAAGVALLDRLTSDHVPALVRSLVRHSLAVGVRGGRTAAGSVPLPISVLNRRRRSARAWIQAVLAGAVDSGTLHAVAHTWAPQLAGTGPDLRRCVRAARSCVEFLRGALTALVFDRPADNLVPEARALQALEAVLAAHLGAIRAAARRAIVV